jgi:hypothetical protein
MNNSAAIEQQNSQRAKQRGRPWPPGTSGNPAGSRVHNPQRQTLQADIEAELGGQVSPADKLLLQRAIELLTRRARSHVDAVRGTNLAHRILTSLRTKYTAAKAQAGDPGLEELLA